MLSIATLLSFCLNYFVDGSAFSVAFWVSLSIPLQVALLLKDPTRCLMQLKPVLALFLFVPVWSLGLLCCSQPLGQLMDPVTTISFCWLFSDLVGLLVLRFPLAPGLCALWEQWLVANFWQIFWKQACPHLSQENKLVIFVGRSSYFWCFTLYSLKQSYPHALADIGPMRNMSTYSIQFLFLS